jgi:hydrogenase maturation factor
MLGEALRDGYITSAGAQIGDRIILTKGIAIEGTALIAREKRAHLESVVPPGELDRCARFLRSPGISVVREARLAVEVGGVHAMHDPTEGGLITALWELAQAAGVGLVIDEAKIPILPECARLSRLFNLDPLGLLASGSLLITIVPERAGALVERLQNEGLRVAEIGEVVLPETGCILRLPDGTVRSFPRFARDEITRLFE